MMPPILASILFTLRIAASVFPVLIMIALIPLVRSDFLLAGIYFLFIMVALALRQDKKDLVFLGTGLVIPAIGEVFLVATGAEIFVRDTLILGIPIWLPLLWGYVFIMMRQGMWDPLESTCRHASLSIL